MSPRLRFPIRSRASRAVVCLAALLAAALPGTAGAAPWGGDDLAPLASTTTPVQVPYADFVTVARAGGFEEALINGSEYWAGARDAKGRIVVAQVPAPAPNQFGAAPETADAATPSVFVLEDILREAGTQVTSVVDTAPQRADEGSAGSNTWLRLAFMLLVSAAFTFLIIRILSRSRGGRMLGGGRGAASAGTLRDNAQVAPPSTRFADVAGCDEAVEELSETVLFLRSPMRFAKVGARMPRGVILHGPPGTGKTLLAKAVAGEADVPFYAVSGSDFVDTFVGVGASRVRDLFVKAAKHPAGAVIFFDEMDAIGRARGRGASGADTEREATLNQLLVEMDGFGVRDKVIVIAATNRLDMLDDALLRPGRFDRQVRVDLPARAGRAQILRVHAKGKPIEDMDDLERLADVTGGSSGADLANILNEAAIMAAREERTRITWADLMEGQLRSLAGPRRLDPRQHEDERQVVAWHEAGHVLAAELCPTHPATQRATILPRGQAGGLALFGQDDRALIGQQELHERLVVALAGRAAEQVAFGHISSGASNDLEQVNGLARHAIETLGFSPRAGQLISVRRGEAVAVSEQTRQLVDEEVRAHVEEAYRDALDLLSSHRATLDAIAQALLAHEVIERADIERLTHADSAPAPLAPSRRHVVPMPTTTAAHDDAPLSAPTAPAPVGIRAGAAVLARGTWTMLVRAGRARTRRVRARRARVRVAALTRHEAPRERSAPEKA